MEVNYLVNVDPCLSQKTRKLRKCVRLAFRKLMISETNGVLLLGGHKSLVQHHQSATISTNTTHLQFSDLIFLDNSYIHYQAYISVEINSIIDICSEESLLFLCLGASSLISGKELLRYQS
jgi:hypothetical protein